MSIESFGLVPIACAAIGALGAIVGFSMSFLYNFEVIGPRAKHPTRIWTRSRVAEMNRLTCLWRDIGFIGSAIALCPFASATMAGLASPQWDGRTQLAFALIIPMSAVAVVITLCIGRIRGRQKQCVEVA
ncbi:MAG: hypothetical protein V4480_00825 [Patescibacteria group bacterium]